MSKAKKLLALILSVTMIFSISSISAGAVDGDVVENFVKANINLVKAVATDISGDFNAASQEFEISVADFKRESEIHGSKAAWLKLGLNSLNVLWQSIFRRLCDVHSDPNWENYSEYSAEKENILFGRETYQTSPAKDAKWSLGYASASIIPNDFRSKKYDLGRSLVISSLIQKEAKARSILDDQRVRVIAVDDGSGEGLVVVAVIDGLGVGSAEIRAIRGKVLEYAKKNNVKISSINVSATHSHSALDTQGVSSNFLYILTSGFFNNKFRLFNDIKRANDPFFEKMINVSAKTIEDAIENMETGSLYYDHADVSDYIYDKRYLIDYIPEMAILRFDPDNAESKETYLANITCHPTSVSASNGAVSGDYIYYLDKNMQAEGYNFIFVQGALGELTRETSVGERYFATDNPDAFNDKEILQKNTEKVKELVLTKYQGRELENEDCYEDLIDTIVIATSFSDTILAAKADGEEKLDPVINVQHKELNFKATNYVLRLACQIGLVHNVVYKTGDSVDDAVLPSEVGYLEFGNRMAFGVYPCEFYPEVFHAGGTTAENSWTGEDWYYDSMNEEIKEYVDGIDLYCICFANDYIGYVVPDNYYAYFGHIIGLGNEDEPEKDMNYWGASEGGVADELMCAGKNTASNIISNFLKLVEDYTKK